MKPANMCINGSVISFLDVDAKFFYPIHQDCYDATFRVMKLQFWAMYNRDTKTTRVRSPLFEPSEEPSRKAFCSMLANMTMANLKDYIRTPGTNQITENIKQIVKSRVIETPLGVLVWYLERGSTETFNEAWVTRFISRIEKLVL